jgi:predicted PhzF superfamily epimerase YddE/YHI9
VREIARCLGVEVRQIIGPVLNAATSRVKTLIRLESLDALHSLRVDLPGVEPLCDRLGSTGLYPYALAEISGPVVSARQFPRSSGYPEDAATGIAAAALAWGLRQQALAGDAETLVTVRQGEAMGSPSMIGVRLPARGQEAQGCSLRGEARAM